jgi:hypothetical protein
VDLCARAELMGSANPRVAETFGHPLYHAKSRSGGVTIFAGGVTIPAGGNTGTHNILSKIVVFG